MGQRNNLQWDLPAEDSFLLNKAIYGVPDSVYRRRIDEFAQRLEVTHLLDKPIRNLSLGERMKMEIIAAMLHGPEVVFLDEPTIGLDVTMQRRVRQFVLDMNKEEGVTVLLTSHYMADVSAMTERVVVISQGSLLYDGALAGLAERFSSHKTIRVDTTDLPADLSGLGRVLERTPERVTLEVERDRVSEVASRLLAAATVTDLAIEEPPLEDVIERVFTQSR